jgi:hypothetical protein
MPGNYLCPKCNSRLSITVEGKVLCLMCGEEMRPVLLYSEIIWPSLKEVAKKEYGYDSNTLKLTDQLLKKLETEDLPTIPMKKITIEIPEITPNSIYELREQIDFLEKTLSKQIKEQLNLEGIKEEIKKREISMTICTKYATSSESPPEQYKIGVEYLKTNLRVRSNPALKKLIEKLEEEKQRSEAEWRYRGTTSARV